jgi:hypothetical protein
MASLYMNDIADKYADQGVGSAFVYTHEAHPGENYRHLTSMEQKYKHARALRDTLGVTRPIYLDVLDGACHTAWGGQPNMGFILTRGGAPVYKADWTHPPSVDEAIHYLLKIGKRRKSGERLAAFRTERQEYRFQDNDGFQKGLERNGPQAVSDFADAMKQMQRH